MRIRYVVAQAALAAAGLLLGCTAGESSSVGPVPTAVACEPSNVYGPRPCRSDAECVEEYGQGWFCDLGHSYSDGCGGEIGWPICKNRQ